MIRSLSLLLSAVILGGCASTAARTGPTALDDSERLATIRAAETDFEKDRRAILAMQGEYAVSFDFSETVVLQSGYARKPRKETPAHETVVLIGDSGRFISLQHLLIAGPGVVVKHWRQDWSFEAPSRWEFTEDQTWRVKTLDAGKTRGQWTQCVYEVSDAPRYCGTGKWNHRYGAPTWTSDRSWRPLPRREYTVRSDYNAINAENRHTITPSGWTHEQDNTKTVRKGETTEATLVREFGFNDYRRISGFDFKPAYDYWEKTGKYWADVRAEWTARLIRSGGLTLKTPVDGMALIGPMFAQAEKARSGAAVSLAEIRGLFEQWVATPGLATTQMAEQPSSASD